MSELRWDIAPLLDYASNCEAVFSASNGLPSETFGHVAPPKLDLIRLSEETFVVVAYTTHTISLQIVYCRNGPDRAEAGSKSSTDSPQLVGQLLPPDTSQEDVDDIIDESIVSVCLVTKGEEFVVLVGTSEARVYSFVAFLEEGKVVLPVHEEHGPLFETLPRDSQITARYLRQQGKAPFLPRGSVTGIWKRNDSVWLTYSDGTIVELPTNSVFPSIWHQGSQEGETVEHLTGRVSRYKLAVPNMDTTIVPVQHYLSPLAMVMENPQEDRTGNVSAVLYGPALPTLLVYTSECPLENERGTGILEAMSTTDSVVLRGVVGGTKAIVGSAMGALRWGFGSKPEKTRDSFEEDHGVDGLSTPFPSLWETPTDMFASHEFHDPPRQVSSCIPSPDNQYIALTDSLGRVWVIDLQSKHIIRLWKGFRQAQCAWIYNPENTANSETPRLCLVIHSQQRRIVEVWPVRGGKRLLSVQVGKDASIFACSGSGALSTMSCFILHSNVIGSSNDLELITLSNSSDIDKEDGDIRFPQLKKKSSLLAPPGSADRTAALKLRHLQQLLTSDNVHYTQQDVLKALYDIESLLDLASALDLLGTTAALEDRIGANAADFQHIALEHCRDTLKRSIEGKQQLGDSNPNVMLLSRKISFYQQLLDAFDHLRQFESNPHDSLNVVRDNTTSHWAVEAEGWATTVVQIMGPDHLSPPVGRDFLRQPARFAALASAVVFPADSETDQGRMRIYFKDSTRTRQDVVVQVFKPLLADTFSFGVVKSIFETMGINDDNNYMMKCFGEWFMTLDVVQISEQGLFTSNPPMGRMLEELAIAGLDEDPKGLGLPVLYSFCESGTDLVRTFMLGVICRDAVLKMSSRKEKNTYGKVLSADIVEEWEKLLRKVRVCLLVSNRLNGKKLGDAPLSVRTVEEEGVFSPYEWIAQDQLTMTHNNDEITSLEQICRLSNFSFDPSTNEGSDKSHVTRLQNSCISAAISEEERAEYLVDFDDDSGALLLFLKHYNEPTLLVAHRALLLAKKWSADPLHLAVLSETVSALRAMDTRPENISLAMAVRLEIWTVHFCPYYKAHLFGFRDVHEINEEQVGALLKDPTWFSSFGRIALQILMMLSELPWDEDCMRVYAPKLSNDGVETWPPIIPDYILSRLVEKCRRIESTAFDNHCATMCGLLLSDDVASLAECVPEMYELFTPTSLFTQMPPSESLATSRTTFLEHAVVQSAVEYSGRAFDSFACLAEVETLAKVWKFDIHLLRSMYLVGMYEMCKDRVVDELLTRSSSDIDVPFFVNGGVDVVCRRLNDFLNSSNMRSGEMRGTIGLLDADLCEWVTHRAMTAHSLTEDPIHSAPVGGTHLLSMRLLSLGASSRKVDKDLRIKIHALVVLSGTLVKTLEGRR